MTWHVCQCWTSSGECHNVELLPDEAWQQLQQLELVQLCYASELLASWRDSDLSGMTSLRFIDISHANKPARFHDSFTALCSLEDKGKAQGC